MLSVTAGSQVTYLCGKEDLLLVLQPPKQRVCQPSGSG